VPSHGGWPAGSLSASGTASQVAAHGPTPAGGARWHEPGWCAGARRGGLAAGRAAIVLPASSPLERKRGGERGAQRVKLRAFAQLQALALRDEPGPGPLAGWPGVGCRCPGAQPHWQAQAGRSSRVGHSRSTPSLPSTASASGAVAGPDCQCTPAGAGFRPGPCGQPSPAFPGSSLREPGQGLRRPTAGPAPDLPGNVLCTKRAKVVFGAKPVPASTNSFSRSEVSILDLVHADR
jgi:hypothetical protein